MSVKMRVKVTKEILIASAGCGYGSSLLKGCAIALAIRDIFPNAEVTSTKIRKMGGPISVLPKKARDFIEKFDRKSPEERILMNELEFEINVHDRVINKISIDEVKRILQTSDTLELVNQ